MEGLPQSWSPEKQEQQELFRATLGFDIIFVKDKEGRKQPYCVEINGEDSGAFGFDEIPSSQADPTLKRIVEARTRYHRDVFKKNRLRTEIWDELADGRYAASPEAETRIKEYMKRNYERQVLIPQAFQNPKIIREIIQSKVKQQEYIPEHARPRTYDWNGPAVSSTGLWIIKPLNGRGGRGIRVITNQEFPLLSEERREEIKLLGIVQELLPAEAADLAEAELGDMPASLRLLMDFQYFPDGSIKPVFEVAYQRVAQPKAEAKSLADMYVVNKSTGALSRAASEEERQVAHGLAIEIIQNIGRRIQEPAVQAEHVLEQLVAQALEVSDTKAEAIEWVIKMLEKAPGKSIWELSLKPRR